MDEQQLIDGLDRAGWPDNYSPESEELQYAKEAILRYGNTPKVYLVIIDTLAAKKAKSWKNTTADTIIFRSHITDDYGRLQYAVDKHRAFSQECLLGMVGKIAEFDGL